MAIDSTLGTYIISVTDNFGNEIQHEITVKE